MGLSWFQYKNLLDEGAERVFILIIDGKMFQLKLNLGQCALHDIQHILGSMKHWPM